ncbi:Crp/Fnr family transcriptional regulator [Edaphocola aurantiacus]|uniref:Crp/Fnr family transcriptional regulator n=1 Tax=Edaphocola aurantiacus TaxID=2601682 RepID=UPI001C961E79|nr:Crp/Fnr family transcriptional regulator [Edaphocola aurantiacus]
MMQDGTQQLSQYLRSLYSMPEDILQEGINLFQAVQVPKGAFLFREGMICRELAFVHYGLLRAFSLREDGRELSSCFAMEHDFACDYNSLIHSVPASKSIQALEDCQLMVITHHNLQQLQDRYPAWQHMGKILADKEFIEKERWANRLRLDNAAERYQYILEEQPGLINRVPVNQLASYLGMTTRTLSRVRKALCRQQ